MKTTNLDLIAERMISIIDPEMGRENYLAKLKQFAPNHVFADSKLVLLNDHPIVKFLILKLFKSVPSFPRIKNCNLWTASVRFPIFQKHNHIAPYLRESGDKLEFEPISDRSEFLVPIQAAH
jgi:hypothetical protein